MNIFIFISDDCTFQPQILEEFLTGVNENVLGLAVVPGTKVRKSKFLFFVRYLIMLGPVLFARKSWQTLRAIFLNNLSKVIPLKHCYSVYSVAVKRALRMYKLEDINDQSFVNIIKGLNLDLIVSFPQPQIIKKTLLKIPKLGIINVHPGMLPKYRGPAPLFWALMNDEKYLGLTTHFMDEKIDNGPILVQRKIPIDTKTSYHALTQLVNKEIPSLLLETIDYLKKQKGDYIFNDSQQATYSSLPTLKQVISFRLKGKKTI